MIFGFLLAFAIPLLIYAAPHLGQKEFISILDLRLPFWLYLFQFALGLCLAVNLAKDFKDWFKKMISKQWLLTGVIPVAVVALLALIVCLAWIAPRHRVQSDESIFLATAQNLYANQVSGSCDEGEFSANGHLDCQKSVHNFKTKGEPFLYATLMPLFGQDLKWIFPLHIFLLIATIFLLFLAVYAWTSNSNLAFLTTALFAAQPTTLFQFRSASVEPLYTFLFALSVFLWKWAWDKNTIKHWVLLALVLAFFAQTRQETIFCLGAFVIISAFRIYPTLNAELKPFCTFLFELCVFLWELCVFLRKLIWNIKMFLNANPKLKKTNPIPRIPDFSQLSIFIRLFNSQFSIFLLTISIFCIPVLLTISYYQGYDFQGGEFSAHGHFFENLKQAWNLSVNTKPDNIGLLINPFLSSFSILTMLGILTLLGFSYYEWKNKSQKSDKGQPAYYILAFLLLYFPQIFMILENVSGDLTIEINQRYTLVAFPAMAFLCGFFIDKASLLLPQNNRLFFVFVAAGILWGNTLRYNDSFEKNIMYNRNHLTTEEAEILKWLRNEPKNNRLFVYSRPWHFIGYGINSIHYNSLNPQRLSELLKKYNGEVYYVRGLDCWDSQTYHKKAIEHRIATVCDRFEQIFPIELVFNTVITNNYRLIIAKLKEDGTGSPLFAPQEVSIELPENAEWLGEPTEYNQEWGSLQIDKSVTGKPITIAKKRYKNGIGTHASGSLRWKLNGEYEKLTAVLGLDEDEFCSNGVQIKIIGDGNLLTDTGKLGQGQEYPLDISLKGINQLTFETDGLGDIGCDHVDIAAAMLFKPIP